MLRLVERRGRAAPFSNDYVVLKRDTNVTGPTNTHFVLVEPLTNTPTSRKFNMLVKAALSWSRSAMVKLEFQLGGQILLQMCLCRASEHVLFGLTSLHLS
jgi:hypothetical protein